jgi:S-ribosylhomocysteine lyase
MDVENMERIKSFSLDHDVMQPGLYCNMESHGVTTWDLRFKKPNDGDYITPKACHSIEHMLATVLRNSEKKDDIIYFGPMGCRTGFYLLTVNLSYAEVLPLLRSSFAKALEFKEVPGSAKIECGNYLEHDLAEALKECKNYLSVLEALS